jgi:hypothetical protein
VSFTALPYFTFPRSPEARTIMSDRQKRWASSTGTAATAPAPAAPARAPRPGGPPAGARGRGHLERFGQTDRTDAWWFLPALQGLGLVLLGLYANYAAFLGQDHYHYVENGRHYLSPFYSPYLKPSWLPSWFSPALLILIFPLGFRATCYYYRKAYYRSFFADPPGCSVGEPRKGYDGETKFPFILQNLHRYFLYAALVFLVILWLDVLHAATFTTPEGNRLGIGGGTLAILASTLFITLYTFSCHSLRHLIGGKLDCFSCVAAGGPRHKVWHGVSVLNEHHMAWAWVSLFAVCFADFYVRACSMGWIQDPVFFLIDLFTIPTPIGL